MNNIRQIIEDSRCLLHKSLFSLNKGEQVSSAGQDPHNSFLTVAICSAVYLAIKTHFKTAVALQCVYQGSLFLFSLKTVNKKIWCNLGASRINIQSNSKTINKTLVLVYLTQITASYYLLWAFYFRKHASLSKWWCLLLNN